MATPTKWPVVWRGYLRLSLVAFPVRAYSAGGAPGSEIRLNQLHDKCHSRIRYKKTCPLHGETPNDQIVMGYEFAKDQYVVIDPDEVDQLRTESERSIGIEQFLPSTAVAPTYFSGKSYYLAPDGPAGHRPYNLIRDCMADRGLHAVVQAVISKREQIALLWPWGRLLVMSGLEYGAYVRDPAGLEDQVGEASASAQERKLAGQLIDELLQEQFEPDRYRDKYTEKLSQLIEAKVQGREVVAPPQQPSPAVVNLMDALRKSVRRGQGRASGPGKTGSRALAVRRPPRKAQRRKSG